VSAPSSEVIVRTPPPREHELEVAQSVIIGGFLLFLCIIALFTLDLRFAGKAVDSESTVFILNATPVTCNFTAYTGYNIVSVPCIYTATPINDVLSAGAPVGAVYQYIPGSQDPWKVYNPNLPWYAISDLQTLSRRSGYVVVMNGPLSVAFNGSVPSSTIVPITTGWNLIGYPSTTPRNVTDAFDGINASYNKIVAYNKSTEQFVSYVNPAGGDLDVVYPNSGYWVNASAIVVWTVMR
jgi:hypothetical protein